MPPPRVSPRPPPLRIARKKPPPTELMGPPSTIAQTSPPALNNVAFFPQSTTIHLPNTASTSTSISEGESSLTIPTPPLSDATSSPPLSSGRPPSVEDKSLLPNVQFGPRPARNSKRVSSSFLLEQRRGVEIPSAEEFGVPNSSFPVVSVPRPSQSTADELYPPSSPTPSLPNPYTTSLTRTMTASSNASSTLSSSSSGFGPRPRIKPVLTLSVPDSKAAVSIATIAINDTSASLPNPFQPQANLQSHFSPHTPQHPLNHDSQIQTGGASCLGADLNTGFGVSYFSPHTPASTSLLSTATGTSPISTKRGHQDEKGSWGRTSGSLAVPPNAAVGSCWSPYTPDVPEGLERAMDEAVVKELEGIPVKEIEFLKADYKTHSYTPTTAATDGHSIEPSSTPPRDLSPHSSNDAITDVDLTASDSSSPLGNGGLVPNPSKPQLTLQTWDLDKMRDKKIRQEPTAARRQRSRDKDAKNKERKGRGKAVQKEAETFTQTTEVIKGGDIPPMLKPGGVPVARSSRPLQQVAGSNTTLGAREKSELSLLPAALRPGSQLFQALPQKPPTQSALRSQRSQPVLDMPEPATQVIDISASLTQNRHSIAITNAWGLTPNSAGLSLGSKANSDTDRFAHGRSPSEPNFPNVSVMGPGGTQEAKLGKEGIAKERARFGFFANAGGTASDTNLAGLAASTTKKSKDAKDVNDLKENRKSAFYSRGINASFEALVGWGGKIFSSSSTSVDTYGQSSKKGEEDERLPHSGTTGPAPVTAQPHPYAQYQIPPLSTQHQDTPPLQAHAPNPRVYATPSYPSGERGPSFEELGVEIGWAGRNRTHMPPHSNNGHGATAQGTAIGADPQPVKKGHTKNSSSGVSGFMRMFGFGKKEKAKDKQKWIQL